MEGYFCLKAVVAIEPQQCYWCVACKHAQLPAQLSHTLWPASFPLLLGVYDAPAVSIQDPPERHNRCVHCLYTAMFVRAWRVYLLQDRLSDARTQLTHTQLIPGHDTEARTCLPGQHVVSNMTTPQETRCHGPVHAVLSHRVGACMHATVAYTTACAKLHEQQPATPAGNSGQHSCNTAHIAPSV